MVRDLGCKPGVAINPAEPISVLDCILGEIDMVLLMSVNPGFGGQKFIPYVLDKISQTKELIESTGHEIRIEVDGGITVENIGQVARAGADTFVSGSAIFGASDYAKAISEMRRNIESG